MSQNNITHSLAIYNSGRRTGENIAKVSTIDKIDHLIHDTEDCPLYEDEERDWLIGAYYTVRRLVNDTDKDFPRHLDKNISPCD